MLKGIFIAFVCMLLSDCCSGCITMYAWQASSPLLTVETVEGYLIDGVSGQCTGIVVGYANYDAQSPRLSDIQMFFAYAAAMAGFEGREYAVVIPADATRSPAAPYGLQPKTRTANGIWAELSRGQLRAEQQHRLKVYERNDVHGTDIEKRGVRFVWSHSGARTAGDFVRRPCHLVLENCAILYWKDQDGIPRPFEGSLADAVDSPSARFIVVPRVVPRPAQDARRAIGHAVVATPFLLMADVIYTPVLLAISPVYYAARWADEWKHPEMYPHSR